MKYASAPIPRDEIALIPRTLGDLIPEDHPLRLIDELLGKLDWTVFAQKLKIERRGRPPLAPQILVAVWIYAFFRKVSSSRQLEYQLRNNVEFMWLAHGHAIDHTTLAIFRKNHTQEIKQIHRDLIRLAKDVGVTRVAELYVDATRIQANSSRHHTLTGDKAKKLLEIVEQEIDQFLKQAELHDDSEDLFGEADGEQLPAHLRTLQQRKAQLEGIVETCLEADAAKKKKGKKGPSQTPATDTDSRVLPNKDGGFAPNYTPVVGVEGELGLIVSTAIINSSSEHDVLVPMLDSVESDYEVNVEIIGADAAYSTGHNISELEYRRGKDFVSPHRNGDPLADNPAIREDPTQPVQEQDLERLPIDPANKVYSPEAFVYDEETDTYRCPQGRLLTPKQKETREQSNGEVLQVIRYECESCEGCPLLASCRKGVNHKRPRSISRDEHESNRQAHRQKMSTKEAKARYAKRFSPGERCFAQIKTHFGARRFQTRGKESVESEFGLLTLAHNVLRLANHWGSLIAMRTEINGQPTEA